MTGPVNSPNTTKQSRRRAAGSQPDKGRLLHNVRNQLSVILGFCDLLLDDIPEHDRKHGDIAEMRKAANRALTLLEETRSAT